MVYAKKCYDEVLTEKVIHHLLDKHRVHKNQEWFKIDQELSKQIIDISQLFLDEFIPYTDLFVKYNVYDKFKQILDDIKENENVIEAKKDEFNYTNVYQKKTDIINVNKNKEKEKLNELVDKMDIKVNNPLDFDQFIKDCCQVGDNLECIKMDLYGAHKIWSRNAESGTKAALQEYMNRNYKSKKRFFEIYNSTLLVFIGIKPKDFVFIEKTNEMELKNYYPKSQLLSKNKIEYERFIIERCKVGFTFRTSYQNIYDEFINWKGESFTLNNKERTNFRDYLNTMFFPNHVYLKDSNEKNDIQGNSHGVWGITLLNDLTNTGLNISSNTQKKVVQIDITTKKIINTWDSATQASKALGVGPSVISTDIKFERIRQNSVLKYVDKENKEIKVRKNKGKTILKINVLTKRTSRPN